MERISIVQGEHAVVSRPNVVISTVLGSCVAVCLQDSVARVGGMNHFLLGEPDHRVQQQNLSSYGIHAMELLINEMMKLGAARNRLRAHLYGGANMIAGLGMIGSSNAEFARRFVEAEGIAIAHVDLGGNQARRVEFQPFEGRSRCNRVVHAPDPVVTPPVRRPLQSVGDLELF
ncbi:chemotaxis protein CheD [Novosphingobium sp. RD2P27]|uniref:Probable chemoreceptor glutamine deamidase CheD n=1 Tax=Novosphingobium kalidii TaxID=3230299 RepID=A0ABV2CXN1_9SPHN